MGIYTPGQGPRGTWSSDRGGINSHIPLQWLWQRFYYPLVPLQKLYSWGINNWFSCQNVRWPVFPPKFSFGRKLQPSYWLIKVMWSVLVGKRITLGRKTCHLTFWQENQLFIPQGYKFFARVHQYLYPGHGPIRSVEAPQVDNNSDYCCRCTWDSQGIVSRFWMVAICPVVAGLFHIRCFLFRNSESRCSRDLEQYVLVEFFTN